MTASVEIGPLCLDEYEVTNAGYTECVTAGRCTPVPEDVRDVDPPNHPITWVDAFQAEAYCTFRSMRLPTELEWELAAYGTDGRTYPWGNDASQLVNIQTSDSCGVAGCVDGTAPVGSHPVDRGPYGAYDMAGNVAEWVDGWIGNSDRRHRIVKGSSWWSMWILSYEHEGRLGYPPNEPDMARGFRCASDVVGSR